MARMRNTKILAIGLVIGQMLGAGVWLPTHNDADYSVWPGQAKVQEHRDNGPCRDVPLSHEDYCTICAAAQGRVSFKAVSVTPPQLEIVGRIEFLAFVAPSRQLHLDSLSRRGPPSSLLA